MSSADRAVAGHAAYPGRLIALLTIVFAVGTVGTALAQPSLAEVPYISRVCLWNADRGTWRALDLKRVQVQRLEELRKEFPAVVDGQWMLYDDEVKLQHDPWPGGPVVGPMASTVPPGDEFPVGSSNTPSFSALQKELRKVLSVAELRAWKRLCGG